MGTADNGIDFANFGAGGESAFPSAPKPSKSFDSDFASAFTNSSAEDQSTSQMSKSSGSKRQSRVETRPQWGSRSFSAFDYRHQDEFDIFGNSDSKSVSSTGGRSATLDDIFASSEKPPMTANNKKNSDDRSVNSSTIEEVVKKDEIEAMFGMAFKNDDKFGEDASLATDIDSRDGTSLTITTETKDGSSHVSADVPKTPLSNPLGDSDDDSDETEGSMERRKKELRQKHFKLNFPDKVNDLENDLETSPKSLDLMAQKNFDPFSLGTGTGESGPMSFHSSFGPNGFAADFLVGSAAPQEDSNDATGKWVMDRSSSQRGRGLGRASTGRGLSRNRSDSITAHSRDRDDLAALVAGTHRPRAISRQRSRMRDRDSGNSDAFKVVQSESSGRDRRSQSELRVGRQSRSRSERHRSPSRRQRSSEVGEDHEERRSGRKHRSHLDYTNGEVEERRRASRMRRSEGQIGLPEADGVSRRHRTERRTRSSDDVYREQRDRDRRGESTGRPSRRADVDKSRMYHSERGSRTAEVDEHRRRERRRDKSEDRRRDRNKRTDNDKGNDVVVDRNEARRLIAEMKDRKSRRGEDENDNRRSRREDKERRKRRGESSEDNAAAAMLAQLKERKARRERGEDVGESPLKLGEKDRRRRHKDREEEDGRRRRRDESRRERRPRSEMTDTGDKNPSSPRSQKSRMNEDGSSSNPFFEELAAVSPRRIPRRYKKYMKETGVSDLSKKDIERINLASIVKEASGDSETGVDDGSSADREFIEKIVQKVMSVNKALQEKSGGDLAKGSKQRSPSPVKSHSYRKKKSSAVPTE